MIEVHDKVVLNEDAWDKVYNWGLQREAHEIPFTDIKKSLLSFRLTLGKDSEVFYDIRANENSFNVFTVEKESNGIVDYFKSVDVDGVNLIATSEEYAALFKHLHPNSDYDSYLQDFAFFISSLFAYISEYREVRERIKKTEIISNRGTKKSKKKNKRVVKIGVYYINDCKEQTQTTKKERNVQTESWGVRGHWRNLKHGLKTWVNPYVKGSGSRVQHEYSV